MKLWEFGLPCGKHHTLQRVLLSLSGFTLIFFTVFSSYTHPPSPLRPVRVHPSAPILSSSISSPSPLPSHPPLQPHPHPSPPPPSPAPASSAYCDLSSGEWVWNPEGPYYTNLTCQEIQEHQNCIKFGRPDRDFLKWRWKPDACELPVFDPAEFLRLLRGRSMAFVGDSLARNQMQSLICLLSRVENPRDISHTPDQNFRRMHYESHNFTLSIFWSPFLVRAEEGHLPGLSWSGLWNLYLDEPDPAWASQVASFDYVVISGGNWFTRPTLFYEKNRMVGSNYFLQSNITVLTLHYGNRKAFRTALDAIGSGEVGFGGVLFLRTLSPSHFENGEWDKGGDCVRRRPYRGGNETAMVPMEARLYEDQMEEYRRAKGEGEKKGVEFRLLDATRAMLLRPDGHPSRYGHPPQEKVAVHNDCVHWCLPGPVDMWNDLLLHMLKG